MPRSLRACNNVADLRHRACRKLPAPMFHYIDAAADDEWSMHHNTQAFNKHELMPSQLRDVSGVDLRAKVLGAELDMPLILAPTGMSRLFHHEKEIAVAKAAEKLGDRQLDTTAATVDCIAPVRRAVGAETEIVVDSSIRRGTHVLKGLALGADACGIGRPYLYGLAAGGQRGVERVLRLLCNELERDMALLGCRSIDEVSAERVLFCND